MKTAFLNIIWLVLVMALPAAVQGQFYYATNNGVITITGYSSPVPTDLTIPSEINGLPVTAIGDNAFNSRGLASVTIPSSITNIESTAFLNCENLNAITVDPLNPAYSSADGVWFNKTQTTLIQYPQAKAGTNFIVPNSVTSIGDYAFYDCGRLASVTIPNSVTSIGFLAFNLCSSLASVTIPDSVTSIGDWAFSWCTGLAGVTILGSVTNIGSAPFEGCAGISAITVDTLNPAYSSLDGVLFDKKQATLIEWPAGKTGNYYTIPDGVTSLGHHAFSFSGLVGITIPNSVTNIRDAFFWCTVLRGVYFKGNAPDVDPSMGFFFTSLATVYYLPGTIGWASTFANRPTAPWPLPIQINVTNPAVGFVSGDNLYVQVGVTSTYEIKSVTATVADRTTNLIYDANLGWTGNLALGGLARGTQILNVVATDIFSYSGQAQASFVLPPVLTVIEPAAGLVRPQFRVRANVTGDDPIGAVIKVSVNGRFLATATNTLDAVVDISETDGSIATLEFDATDSVGHNVATQINVYVCSNTNVVEVDRVGGTIRDVSTDRILFTSGNLLISKSRATGTETVLFDRGATTWDTILDQAFLTPDGAIFIINYNGGLYEAREGTIIDLGPAKSNSLIVKGNYAIWFAGGLFSSTLTLRDLLAQTNVVISVVAGEPDVAANGDVVYSGVYRYRSGISTLIGNGATPLTDGVNVSYTKAPGFTNFALLDGTNEIILGTAQYTYANPTLLTAGWTAFTKPGNGGTTQAWTRSPSGVQSQRTFFGDPSALVLQGLASNGDIMFVHQGRLYFAAALAGPEDLVDFGTWNFIEVIYLVPTLVVQPFWLEGKWYASMGGSLVNIVVPRRAAIISTPAMTPTGQFSFHVSAGNGQQIITQQSSDLATWVSVTTNYVTGTSGMQVAVPAPGNSSKQFYRIVSVQ